MNAPDEADWESCDPLAIFKGRGLHQNGEQWNTKPREFFSVWAGITNRNIFQDVSYSNRSWRMFRKGWSKGQAKNQQGNSTAENPVALSFSMVIHKILADQNEAEASKFIMGPDMKSAFAGNNHTVRASRKQTSHPRGKIRFTVHFFLHSPSPFWPATVHSEAPAHINQRVSQRKWCQYVPAKFSKTMEQLPSLHCYDGKVRRFWCPIFLTMLPNTRTLHGSHQFHWKKFGAQYIPNFGAPRCSFLCGNGAAKLAYDLKRLFPLHHPLIDCQSLGHNQDNRSR